MEPFDRILASYLEECFDTGSVPRVTELADRLGLSTWTLTRRCEHAIGKAPGRTIRRAQVRHAAELLVASSKPLRVVARASGFASTRTFHRTFRRIVGMTPNEYRAATRR